MPDRAQRELGTMSDCELHDIGLVARLIVSKDVAVAVVGINLEPALRGGVPAVGSYSAR